VLVRRTPIMGSSGAIELHIKDVSQLFDSLDPYPIQEKDLDDKAEAYIVASVRESRLLPGTMIFHVDQPGDDDKDARLLTEAIQKHFVRKAQLANTELRALMRRGWISLAIGLAFLFAMLALKEILEMRLGVGALVTVLREGLVIVGWVAMWRPLEIFLYDWWPIAGQRRSFQALSQIPVSVQHATVLDKIVAPH
jgi:hypothetical protein